MFKGQQERTGGKHFFASNAFFSKSVHLANVRSTEIQKFCLRKSMMMMIVFFKRLQVLALSLCQMGQVGTILPKYV